MAEQIMNTVTAIATDNGRDYITPEDVSDALRKNTPEKVRIDVLEVIGRQTNFGAEDHSLCAFIAFRGTPE